jgi:glycogen debranching enzyme
LLETRAPVIHAGLDYGRPWTRDAAINAWNGASLIVPEATRNTLISVLTRSDDKLRIGGQYWDCIVWATGAWNHYLYTGDREFLSVALEATANSLEYAEQTEFNPEMGLFHGAGWSDGVAAYPPEYAATGGSSAILDWPKHNPDKVSKPGYGIPMQALSTNCLYYNAYRTGERMAVELGVGGNPTWRSKAANLKKAINHHLWNPRKGAYRFFIAPFGGCDHQEALGQAYAILFGIADAEQVEAIFKNQHVTPAGVPCTWPSFPRYESPDGKSFGRHSGTVWPQIQGFWADTAARFRNADVFAHELFQLATHADRDMHFAEIYHPLSGEPYGGMQEAGSRGIILWRATSRQTWAATAYLRMVFLGLAGMRFEPDGVRLQPCLPEGVSQVELRNLHYRNLILDVTLRGNGTKVKQVLVDGQECQEPFLDNREAGKKEVAIVVGDA